MEYDENGENVELGYDDSLEVQEGQLRFESLVLKEEEVFVGNHWIEDEYSCGRRSNNVWSEAKILVKEQKLDILITDPQKDDGKEHVADVEKVANENIIGASIEEEELTVTASAEAEQENIIINIKREENSSRVVESCSNRMENIETENEDVLAIAPEPCQDVKQQTADEESDGGNNNTKSQVDSSLTKIENPDAPQQQMITASVPDAVLLEVGNRASDEGGSMQQQVDCKSAPDGRSCLDIDSVEVERSFLSLSVEGSSSKDIAPPDFISDPAAALESFCGPPPPPPTSEDQPNIYGASKSLVKEDNSQVPSSSIVHVHSASLVETSQLIETEAESNNNATNPPPPSPPCEEKRLIQQVHDGGSGSLTDAVVLKTTHDLDVVEGKAASSSSQQQGKDLTSFEMTCTDSSSIGREVDANSVGGGMTQIVAGVKGGRRRKSVGKKTTPPPPPAAATTGEVVKSNERGATLPQLPDLNNTTIYQPFTDNQQVQLRAQILVYGSLISGSAPEEAHMIAAFGQSDGGRRWEGVWRACSERLHVQKKAPQAAITTTTAQLQSVDEGVKLQNKASGGGSPMIPLWSTGAPLSGGIQPLSPFQAAVPNLSWLSQGGPIQWIAPPVKELKHHASVDSKSKSRKRKKGSATVADPPSLPTTLSAQNQTPKSKSNISGSTGEETLRQVEESKIHAKDAAESAAAAVAQCEAVWSQLETYNRANDEEAKAKLASSAVSLAAAASVAKVAAAAAKIASDAARRSMLLLDLSQSTSIIYRKATEAAAASKHAENVDAVVKAAELAAEAVSHAGHIVAMTQPFPLPHLLLAGPHTYWKPPSSGGNLNNNTHQGGGGGPNTKRRPRVRRAPRDLSIESTPNPKQINGIKEGCLVEVHKDDAWFGAHVLSFKDGKALVCYTEIQGSGGRLKEWVALEGSESDKIRVAHPFTLMHPQTKKRSRIAATDFEWSTGDRVDVWIQDRWREGGVVVETNKIDPTCLTVKYPGGGETSTVRSWFVRPSLIWKDGKWVECHNTSSSSFQQREEKRMKLASPSKREEEEEKTTLAFSTQETLFSVGSTRTRSGLQQKGGVVIGVPKPGKKQKFMDVSKHYVGGDGSNKQPTASTRYDSGVKFTRYLIPQAPPRGSGSGSGNGIKNNNNSSAAKEKEKQIAAKPPRKPPVPSLRTLVASSKTAAHQNQFQSEKVSAPRSSRSERLNKRKFVSSSSAAAAATKEEKSVEVEPSRRSNRKIQPTSRLLEGLQTSISISKTPAGSQFTTPKGNTNNA